MLSRIGLILQCKKSRIESLLTFIYKLGIDTSIRAAQKVSHPDCGGWTKTIMLFMIFFLFCSKTCVTASYTLVFFRLNNFHTHAEYHLLERMHADCDRLKSTAFTVGVNVFGLTLLLQ